MTAIDRRAVLRSLAAALLVNRRAMSAEREQMGPQKLTFAMRHRGADVAAMQFDVDAPDEGVVRSRGNMETTGLVRLLEGARQSSLESVSRLTEGMLQPLSFRAVYKKPDRKREITIDYGPDGDIAELSLINNGKSRSSDVPEGLWADTVDPLTSILRLQDWLTRQVDHGSSGQTVSQVFDGRSRWDFELSFEPPVIELVIRSIIGFDDDDLIVTLPNDEDSRALRIELADRQLATPEIVEGKRTILELVS
ncbi:MAG: DUF3108 domain-containing protein [Pseudomonadota bacterium]